MPALLQRHYRTVILLCCFLILFANQGLPATSFNVYQSYLVELPGVGAVGGSFVLTVRAFVSLVVMFFVAAFYRRVDPRYGVLAATLSTAAGFALFGLLPTLAGLVAGSVLTGIGYGLGGMVATTMILGRWFAGSVGKAAGFIGMGSGVASFVIPTLAAEIIEAAGLSTAFFCEAALALLLALLFAVFLRSDPRQVGLEPYRAEKDGPASDGQAQPKRIARTRRDGARHDLSPRERRLMLFAVTLMGGVAITGFGYFSVLLTSSGISPLAAAVITSIGGACLATGKLACGWAFDRWGTRTGTIVFFAVLVIGLGLCTTVAFGGQNEGFFAAVLFCTGISVSATGIAVWSLELSSATATMKTIRDFNLAYAAGGFVFNMMPGILAELTGSYAATYGVFIVFSLVSAVIIARTYTRRYREAAC